nr:unnamed protein product [Callosobruchus chinensis]
MFRSLAALLAINLLHTITAEVTNDQTLKGNENFSFESAPVVHETHQSEEHSTGPIIKKHVESHHSEDSASQSKDSKSASSPMSMVSGLGMGMGMGMGMKPMMMMKPIMKPMMGGVGMGMGSLGMGMGSVGMGMGGMGMMKGGMGMMKGGMGMMKGGMGLGSVGKVSIESDSSGDEGD